MVNRSPEIPSEGYVSRAVKETFKQLGLDPKELIVKKRLTPEKKTERLLKYYPKFKQIIPKREEAIRKLEEDVDGVENGGPYIKGAKPNKHRVKLWAYIYDEKDMRMSLLILKNTIKMVDDGLEHVKNDTYYEVLPLYFFEGYTWKEVGEKLGIAATTAKTHCDRLIKEITFYIFPDLIIEDILQ